MTTPGAVSGGRSLISGARRSDRTRTLPRFKPYPAYKASGIAWLGEIPAGWEITRLRSTMTGCQNGVWGDEPDGLHDVVCVRVADFNRVAFSVDIAEPTLRSIDPAVVAARGLRPGNLLLEKSGGGEKQPVGAVVLFDHQMPAVCSNFVARITIAKGHDPRYQTYLHAALYAQRINTRHIKQSTGIQNLDSSSYLDEAIGLPPELEQRAIAAFLDRETARIDALVAKKERLIELLQEQRTALIESAVATAKAPPETRLGYHVDLLPGYAFPSNEFTHNPDDIRLLRGTNISTDGIRWDDTALWPLTESKRYAKYQLREGDLVFGMDRPWIGSGVRVAEVTRADVPSLLLQRVARLRARPGLTQEFLKLVLRSPQFQAFFEPILTGISVPHVSPEQILSFRLRLPTLEDQAVVWQTVKRRLLEIGSMCEVLRQSINHVKEFRNALIAAAVTGKIDVRAVA
jgi:type I restriction enzyme, S subunit